MSKVEYDFCDNEMFGWIMTFHPQLCKKLIETILGIKVKSFNYLEDEKQEEVSPNLKTIKLEVWAKDDNHVFNIKKNNVFNVEMQTCKGENLEMRARYYQSATDALQLKNGVEYNKLKNNYLICICDKDYLGFGENVAHFHMVAESEFQHALALSDGRHIIFLTANRFDKGLANPKLEDLLKYIHTKKPTDSFTEELARTVETVNKSKEFHMCISRDVILHETKDALKKQIKETEVLSTELSHSNFSYRMAIKEISRLEQLLSDNNVSF